MAADIISISPATLADARDLAPRLSWLDHAETLEASDLSPTEQLEKGVSGSEASWTVRFNGQIAGMWGWRRQTLVSDSILLWMLGTPLIQCYKKQFLRLSRALLAVPRAARQRTFVLEHYDAARRWLRWLGFEEIQQHGRWIACERRTRWVQH